MVGAPCGVEWGVRCDRRDCTAVNREEILPPAPPTPCILHPPACRSRVVSIKSPERGYHIFYQLTAGASEEQRAELG